MVYRYVRFGKKVGFSQSLQRNHEAIALEDDLYDSGWRGEKLRVSDGGMFCPLSGKIVIDSSITDSTEIIGLANLVQGESEFEAMLRVRRETAQIIAGCTGLPVDFKIKKADGREVSFSVNAT